ncbi:MAG: radical SAM protein [Acidobacteriia bacterium]|nr:radical SAM protein [Terriglobia bacterium]
MTLQEQHQRAIGLYNQGQHEGAAHLLAGILQVNERSDIWNDWAVAQAASGRLSDAKNGFERALQLDPTNGEAAANLTLVLAHGTGKGEAPPTEERLDSRFRSLAAEALHRDAVQRFRQGKAEEAAALISQALNTEPTSVRWNDFGTIQLALNNTAGAEQGYRQALQVDPQNQLAAVNLVILLEDLGRSKEASYWDNSVTRELVLKQCDGALQVVAQQCNSRLFEEHLWRYIRHVPDQDASLPEGVMQALRRRGDSGFFVQHCYQVVTELPPNSLPSVLEALERVAARDHRFSSLLAFWHMKSGDFDAALRFFQAAFDKNPADLFAEAMIVACEHARHELNPEVPDRFAGIEEYLAGSFCDRPWKHMEIGVDDGVYVCCPAWLPLCIGTPKNQSAPEIWNSQAAAEIRKSVLEGSFRHCSRVHCPQIAARTLSPRSAVREHFPELLPIVEAARQGAPGQATTSVPQSPTKLVLSYDRSCNLACLQCRTTFYTADAARQQEMERNYEQLILELAKEVKILNLDGSGEVFGSKHSRRILGLLGRAQFPQLRFSIISNGQLFDRRAFDTFDLRGRVERIDISIDAARPETYKLVRRGGDFRRLLDNLAFLDGLRIDEGEKFELGVSFVVSATNFREIPEFVCVAKQFHANSVLFTILRSWGHLNKDEFDGLNIAGPSHPLHQEFLEILDAPELLDPIVSCGSIQPYHQSKATNQVRKS